MRGELLAYVRPRSQSVWPLPSPSYKKSEEKSETVDSGDDVGEEEEEEEEEEAAGRGRRGSEKAEAELASKRRSHTKRPKCLPWTSAA